MKNIPVLLFALVLFAACQKDSSYSSTSSQTLSSGTKLISARGYTTGTLSRVDTFIYASNGNLQTQIEVAVGQGYSDTLVVSFQYGNGNKDPYAYTITDGAGPTSFTLSYDNKDRVIKDTATPDPGTRSATYSYPNDNIAYTSTGNESADTFYLSNGNITKVAQASVPFDPNDYDLTSFLHSPAYPNPFYTVCQTDNTRMLLTKIDAWEIYFNDYISKDVSTSVNDNGFAETLTYTTDATGKVLSVTAANQTINYTYSSN